MFREVYQTSCTFYAQQQASEAAARSRSSERRTKDLQGEVSRLAARVDALTIGCQAMWELQAEHAGVTLDDLRARISEIDVRDGVEDGKMTAVVRPCSACGRPGSSRRKNCVYCGHQAETHSTFA